MITNPAFFDDMSSKNILEPEGKGYSKFNDEGRDSLDSSSQNMVIPQPKARRKSTRRRKSNKKGGDPPA